MEKKRQKITGTLQKSRFGRNLRCNVYFLFIALYAPSFNPMHQASFPAVTQPGTKTREALLCLYNTTTAESTVPRKGSWSMARTHGAWCERKGHGANARGMVRTHGAGRRGGPTHRRRAGATSTSAHVVLWKMRRALARVLVALSVTTARIHTPPRVFLFEHCSCSGSGTTVRGRHGLYADLVSRARGGLGA